MSMFNLVFGDKTGTGHVVAQILGFEGPSDFGRFRNAWIEKRNDNIVIAVYTRNGGGNRECWQPEVENCDCTGCIQTNILPKHPLYIADKDDDFDCTYCTTWFRVPDEYLEQLRPLAVDPVDMSQVWWNAIESLKS